MGIFSKILKPKIVIRKKLCPKCGAELKDEILFPKTEDLRKGKKIKITCPNCGFKLGELTPKKKIETKRR